MGTLQGNIIILQFISGFLAANKISGFYETLRLISKNHRKITLIYKKTV